MRAKRKREHGAGSAFPNKTRGTFSIAWRQDGKRHYEHGFESEPEARKRLAVVQGELAQGRKGAKSAKTLGQLALTWLKARQHTHAAHYDDSKRWDLHLEPVVGKMRPDALTPAKVKDMIRTLLAKGLAPGSVKLCVAELSSLYSDIVEDGHAQANPCRSLSKKTRALLKSAHDPKNTPHLSSLEDVGRIYAKLMEREPTIAHAYAIGALAGLRTGEVRALDWSHVDLQGLTIKVQVQAGVNGTKALKDGDSRVVPIQPTLAPVLLSWHASTGGKGLVCPPLRRGSRRFLDDHTMGRMLREVVTELGLMMACSCCQTNGAWYEYTRHSYASLMVMTGGSMEDVSRTLGHSTMALTERHYVHLRPDYFRLSTRNVLVGDLVPDPVRLASKLASGGVLEVVKKRVKAA